MSIPRGISNGAIENARREATKLVAKYDKNNNGIIEANEKELDLGLDTRTIDYRMNDLFVDRVTIIERDYSTANGDALNRRDVDIAEAYLRSKDRNGDGKVTWGEKLRWGSSLGNFFQSFRSVEISRKSELVYSPNPYNNDNDWNNGGTRPRPPETGNGGTRPRPPEVDNGGSRPRPPSVDTGSDRPRPPSI
jgi:hypothetical protein